jgi:peroxiredoxin Q/BCP
MSLGRSAKEINAFQVANFMISVDDVETNTRFANEKECGFPVLSDPEKTVTNAYGAVSKRFIGFANRWSFYIDKEGKIVHIEDSVKPGSAGPDVVAKLGELGIPKD